MCLVGCGVNGHDFPNGAVIPTGDRCLECTCVVCHLSSFSTLNFICVLKKKKKKKFGNLFTLKVIFSISFSSRMEMWLVYPFPVMPCIVKTLCIVLATVAHGKQLPLPHPCHFQACISPPYSCPWRVSRQLKV